MGRISGKVCEACTKAAGIWLFILTLVKAEIMKASLKLTAVFEEDTEGTGYTCYIEEIPGVNSQGETLDEAKQNLSEALELVLETRRMLSRQQETEKKVIRETVELA